MSCPHRAAVLATARIRPPHERSDRHLKTAESVRTAIRARADGIIWALSQLPLVTLAVASVSVVNAVLASIRAAPLGAGGAQGPGHQSFRRPCV